MLSQTPYYFGLCEEKTTVGLSHPVSVPNPLCNGKRVNVKSQKFSLYAENYTFLREPLENYASREVFGLTVYSLWSDEFLKPSIFPKNWIKLSPSKLVKEVKKLVETTQHLLYNLEANESVEFGKKMMCLNHLQNLCYHPKFNSALIDSVGFIDKYLFEWMIKLFKNDLVSHESDLLSLLIILDNLVLFNFDKLVASKKSYEIKRILSRCVFSKPFILKNSYQFLKDKEEPLNSLFILKRKIVVFAIRGLIELCSKRGCFKWIFLKSEHEESVAKNETGVNRFHFMDFRPFYKKTLKYLIFRPYSELIYPCYFVVLSSLGLDLVKRIQIVYYNDERGLKLLNRLCREIFEEYFKEFGNKKKEKRNLLRYLNDMIYLYEVLYSEHGDPDYCIKHDNGMIMYFLMVIMLFVKSSICRTSAFKCLGTLSSRLKKPENKKVFWKLTKQYFTDFFNLKHFKELTNAQKNHLIRMISGVPLLDAGLKKIVYESFITQVLEISKFCFTELCDLSKIQMLRDPQLISLYRHVLILLTSNFQYGICSPDKKETERYRVFFFGDTHDPQLFTKFVYLYHKTPYRVQCNLVNVIMGCSEIYPDELREYERKYYTDPILSIHYLSRCMNEVLKEMYERTNDKNALKRKEIFNTNFLICLDKFSTIFSKGHKTHFPEATFKQGFRSIVSSNKTFKNCGYCQKEGSKLRCSACGKVYYCSKECQKRHWKDHKKVC